MVSLGLRAGSNGLSWNEWYNPSEPRTVLFVTKGHFYMKATSFGNPRVKNCFRELTAFSLIWNFFHENTFKQVSNMKFEVYNSHVMTCTWLNYHENRRYNIYIIRLYIHQKQRRLTEKEGYLQSKWEMETRTCWRHFFQDSRWYGGVMDSCLIERWSVAMQTGVETTV